MTGEAKPTDNTNHDQQKAVRALLRVAGLRKAEIYALQWSDVGFPPTARKEDEPEQQAEAVDRWLNETASGQPQPATRALYEQRLQALKEDRGTQRLDQLEPDNEGA